MCDDHTLLCFCFMWRSLLVLAWLASCNAMSFVISRTEHGFSEKPAALGSTIPMLGGYLNLGLYYISIGLGTPAQTVRLHVDTGSSTLGVYSSTCSSCTADPVSYSSTSSSTSTIIQCSNSLCTGYVSGKCLYQSGSPQCLTFNSLSQCAFTVSYGDQSMMQGGLVRDVITLGNQSTTAIFGTIYNSLANGGVAGLFEPVGVEGIIGFGHSSINCAPTWFPTVLDAFNTAGLLNPYVFAMCLTPTAGNLDVGVIDPAKYSGSLNYIAFKTSGTNSGYYTTTLTSSIVTSSLGSTTLPNSGIDVIWDSGTTLVACTLAWCNAFKTAANNAGAVGYSNLINRQSFLMTAADLATWPSISFTFTTTSSTSYTVTLTAQQYMINLGGGNSQAKYYQLGIDLSGQSIFILGDMFLQAVYVLYDNTNNRLGVAPVADCLHVYVPLSCPAGQYLTASSCVTCTSGSYCPAGSTSQANCTAGYFCPTPSNRTLCAPGTYCPAGSTIQGSVCAAGSYCATPATQVACSSGSYCPTGSTVQSLCAAGKYCATTTSSVTCTLFGSYCPAGSTAQTSCTAGYYCVNTTSQQACSAGKYSSSGSTNCTLCAQNTYAATVASASCAACPRGHYSSTGATVCTATPVTSVPLGSVVRGVASSPLPYVYFSVPILPPVCSLQISISSITNKSTFFVSPNTSYPMADICSGVDSLCSTTQGRNLTVSNVQYQQLYIGVLLSSVNNTNFTITASLQACPIALWTQSTVSLAASQVAFFVAPKSAALTCGVSITASAFQGGVSSLLLSESVALPSNTSCGINCVNSTLSNGIRTIEYPLTSLNGNVYIGVQASSASFNYISVLVQGVRCNGPTQAPQVPLLYPTQTPVSSSSCNLRLLGDVTQLQSYVPQIIYATATAINITASRVTVVGMFAGSTIVQLSIAPDASNPSAPTPASVATTLASQSTSASSPLSTAMSQVASIDPSFSSSVSTGPPVYLCPDGSWQSSSLCLTCPAGQYLSGATCVSCSAGTYTSSANSASACQPCAAGTYTSLTGATYCSSCSPGSASSVIGSRSVSDCAACLPGSFTSAFSSSTCSLCSTGTYTPLSGQTVCSACPSGQISLSGSITCSACPSGYVPSSDRSYCTLPAPTPGTSSTDSSSLPVSTTVLGIAAGALVLILVMCCCGCSCCPMHTKCRAFGNKICCSCCCDDAAPQKTLDSEFPSIQMQPRVNQPQQPAVNQPQQPRAVQGQLNHPRAGKSSNLPNVVQAQTNLPPTISQQQQFVQPQAALTSRHVLYQPGADNLPPSFDATPAFVAPQAFEAPPTYVAPNTGRQAVDIRQVVLSSRATSAMPIGWTEYMTDDGVPYYSNETTGQTVWERPVAKPLVAGGMTLVRAPINQTHETSSSVYLSSVMSARTTESNNMPPVLRPVSEAAPNNLPPTF